MSCFQGFCGPAMDVKEDEISQIGVSVTFMAEFATKRQIELNGKTTADVCSQIVVPETKRAKCSYASLLKQKGAAHHVGNATIFLSHAWRYNFLVVLQVILDWCSKYNVDQRSCFVWFDIFSVNQHTGITDFVYWSQGFEQSIHKIGKVIIILSPWDKPIWVDRAWCLYEFWAVLNGKVEHEFLLPEQDQPKFIEYLVKGGKFEDIVKNVDISKAESGDKGAERKIKEAVVSRVGFSVLNEAVTGGLRAWFLKVSDQALSTISSESDKLTGDLQLTAANMRMSMGRVDEAFAMLSARLEEQQKTLGPTDAKVGITLWHLGTAYSIQGKTELAMQKFNEALAIEKEAHGATHPLVATSMMSIGVALYQQGKLDAALEQLNGALSIQRAVLGENHSQTAATLVNVGSVYSTQGKQELALTHFNAALAIQRTVLGENHAETAQTLMNVALAHFQLGQIERGVAEFQQALAIQRTVLGENHPDTALTMLNIGAAYLQQGKLDQALEQYNAALPIQRAALGEFHATTAQTTMQIGAAYLMQGKLEPALAQFNAALAIQKRLLGENHPQTAQTMMNVGTVHMQLGQHDKALEQYSAALAANRTALGDGHPETASMRSNLGTLYAQMGRLDRALEEFSAALAVQRAVLGEASPVTAQTAQYVAAVTQLLAQQQQ